MLRARVALLALVAFGALAPAAYAVGEKVNTAVKRSIHATATIYFTGMKRRWPTFGVYYTLVEIDTLHSVTQLRITPPGKKATTFTRV